MARLRDYHSYVLPFENRTLKSPVFRWIWYSVVRYSDGYCTPIWQFCGLLSVPWELSSQSLAGVVWDPKLNDCLFVKCFLYLKVCFLNVCFSDPHCRSWLSSLAEMWSEYRLHIMVIIRCTGQGWLYWFCFVLQNYHHRELQRVCQHVLQPRVRLLQRDHRRLRRHQVIREGSSED